ncbi:MAG: gliding motility-associated C-terminal domain-containing protein [Flavobacteriales bacterium]|nr:gliding motility-associated C-terminal domain-containing protein [Flavobacteriales bacterium]
MFKTIIFLHAISRKCTLVATLLFVLGGTAFGQSTNLPTRGKTFWAGFMRNANSGAANLRVHILSTTATSGTVSMPLTGWSAPFTVAANGAAIVNVSLTAENIGSGSIVPKGVLITSADSVNVFISSYQNQTHDLTQVLPETSLGSAYRVDAYKGFPNLGNLYKSELLIVGTEDGTQVDIVPAVNLLAGGAVGVPFSITLNAGQTYQLQAATDGLDLTGTTIRAAVNSTCKPFAVFGGSQCALVPATCQACDMVFEQMRPIATWGTRYFTVPVNGVSQFTYRIMADQNATSVTVAGGAPIILNAGQVHEVNGTAVPVCIQANKPISVAQLLQGNQCAGTGDPSLILMEPADRLSKSASFQTLTSGTLNQHSISVVMPASGLGQLTMNGTTVSSALFTPYPNCTDRVYAKIPVSAGVHRLASTIGFQLYMFGLGNGESYGGSVRNIAAVPLQTDSLICGTGPVTLNSPEALTNAQWTTASAPSTVLANGNAYSLTPTASDSYTVTGGSPITGCPRSFTYHIGVPVTVLPNATANGANSTSICQFAPVQLGVSPAPDPAWFDITWSPASSLSDPTIGAPIATPYSTTWYTVDIVSPVGCGSARDSVLVTVQPAQLRDLDTFVNDPSICVGETVQLSSSALRTIATDRFNTTPAPLWNAIQGGSIAMECGGLTGTALYFNGAGQRYAKTNGFNTSSGGCVEFHLKIGSGMAPCEDADPGEDVIFQYSTNNGLSWNTPPNGTMHQDLYPTFLPVSIDLPLNAQGPNVMFKISQPVHSGAGQDNWSIDDLIISRVDNSWLNYAWTPANSSPTSSSTSASPSTSGWYYLQVTDPTGGCVYRDSIHVNVSPAMSMTVTPNSTLCTPAPVQLNANAGAGAQYSWSTTNGTLSATNVANPSANANATATYNVQATNAIGCTVNGAVTITVAPALNLVLSTANDPLCQGQSTQLTAVGSGAPGLTYNWTGAGLNNPNIANPIASPTQTTTYTCTITHTATGCTRSSAITITVNTGYTINAGPDHTVCSTLGQQLNVIHNVPNATYAWTPASSFFSANVQSPIIQTDGTQTFTIVVTDQNGCTVSDNIILTRAFANLPATQNVSGCSNLTNTLTAPAAGVNYAWTTPTGPGPTGPGFQSINATESGAHAVTITDAQGCTGTTTFNVNLFTVPVVNLGPDVSLCGSQGHVLNAGNAGSTFFWSNNATSQSINITNSGVYSVSVTNSNGCIASDNVNVQFNANPVDVLTNVNTCISTPPTLNAGNPGATYLWSNNATTQSITPTTSGTYTVQVTTPQQCTAMFDAVVTLAPTLTVNLGSDTTICQGASVLLDAGTPSATHLWNTAATSQTLNVSTSGTYNVTISNGGCSATDAITINVAPMPIDVLQDVTACITTPPTLNAGNSGYSFLWNTNAQSQSISPIISGTYSVLITSPQLCSATYDAIVTLTPELNVALGNDTTICQGSSLILDAGSPGDSHTWNTSETTQTLTVTNSGTYSVVVSNGGCTASDAIQLTVAPMPVDALSDVVICEDQDLTLDAANNGSTYQWASGQSTQIITPMISGLYSVTVTTANNCTSTFDSQVTISPLINIELGNDTVLCQGTTMILNATSPAATYVWSTGANSPTLSVTQPGNYSVTVQNAGCQATDNITVDYVDAPTDQLTDVTVCIEESVILDAGNPGSIFLWSTGSTDQTISPNSNGTYSVIVTNPNGCVRTFNAEVVLVPMPNIELGNDTILCDGELIVLDAKNLGSTYQWNTGETTRTLEVRTSGTYSVTVNNGYCVQSDSIDIGFNPSPVNIAAHQFITCLDEKPGYVIIDAGNAGAQFNWSTGEATQVIHADTYGTYLIEVTNRYDCSMRDSIEVAEYCPSTLYMPNTFTPNGDGLNDIFIPVGKNISSVHLMIFDRWGGILFESNDPNVGWDGTYQGQLVKNDIYAWKLEYRFIDKNGVESLLQKEIGHVQVLR